MALDAATIIRAASGALFVLLGLAILAVGRRKRGPLGLALLLIGFGSEVMISNFSGNNTIGAVQLELVTVIVSTIGALLVARELPRRIARREGAAIWVGLLVGVLSLVGVFDLVRIAGGVGEAYGVGPISPFDSATLVAANLLFFVPTVAYLVAVGIRAAITPPLDRASALRSIALVALLAPYCIVYLPTIAPPGRASTLVASLALVLGLTIPWIVAAARSRSRLALGAALAWPTLGVLSFAYLLLPANSVANFFDAFGLFGILRIVGWAFLAFVILRHDLLGVALPRMAVSRGTAAAGALALLFIVAQVAQNFFSAEYGLLTGGIVAGTFLFAASPLQRAMERFGERRDDELERPSRQGDARLGDSVARREDVYRKAVRVAMADHVVTRDEDVHLYELAEELGIGAGRAAQIRHEIEREQGGAR